MRRARIDRGALGRLGVSMVLFCTLMGVSVAAPQWRATGSLNVARSGHRAILLPGGEVFVMGGTGTTGNSLASCEIYDPGLGTWTLKAPMSQARTSFTATVLTDGRILVAGGLARARLNSAEIYDPQTDTWSQAPSMNRARSSHSATLLQNGWVLVAGGSSDESNQATSSAEIFKLVPRGWTLTGSLNQGRIRHIAFLRQDGRVVVAGGTGGGGGPGSQLDTVETFSLGTGTWSPAESMTGGRSGHTATRLQDGQILVVAGGDRVSQSYDQATGKWAPTGELNNPRGQHGASLLPDGRVLVTGGVHQFQPLDTAELFDPLLGLWSSVESLGSKRTSHTATPLLNGTVLVAGGSDGTGAVVDSMVFEPPGRLPVNLLLYPQLALGGGFQVVFTASNRSASPWQGTAQLDGGAWPAERNWTLNGVDRTGEASFPITLAPFGTRTFVLGSLEGPFSGWLEVAGDEPSDIGALATAFFYNFIVQGQLDDSTGVAAAMPATTIWFPAERSAAVNTGLAIRKAILPLTFRLYNQDGQMLEEVTRDFEGAAFFDMIFNSVGPEFRGAVQVESGVGFYATVLRQELLPGPPLRFQLTSIPPTPGR